MSEALIAVQLHGADSTQHLRTFLKVLDLLAFEQDCAVTISMQGTIEAYVPADALTESLEADPDE